MLPMDRSARRLDHGSSRLYSYRGVFMSAPVLTLLKRHEGVCHISHAVDTSASSELKAR